MHKSGGSLTQSSMLLIGPADERGLCPRQMINLTQTTSASYLLLASLDHFAPESGPARARRPSGACRCAGGICPRARSTPSAITMRISKERINGNELFRTSTITKLSVHTLGHRPGRASRSMICCATNTASRSNSAIIGNILAYVSVGDRDARDRAPRQRHGRYCAAASSAPAQRGYADAGVSFRRRSCMSPQDAFYGRARSACRWRQCEGRVCGEFVMCYPPGIPILAPGERVTP